MKIREIFDFLCSLAGLLALSPLLLTVVFCILISSGSPVFYLQKRVGLNGKEFELIKFRTMRNCLSGLKLTARGDSRITPIGRILRWTKIDELPQLLNVLKGDMALVGPRPEVPDYVNLQDPSWKVTLSVKPGITDPVTLKLRNEEKILSQVTETEKFYVESMQRYKLEGYADYIANRSFVRDIWIIILTIASILIPSLFPPLTIKEIEAGWKKERLSETG